MGRTTKLPPQLGHTPPNTLSAQLTQNVHSNAQIRASVLSGGKSRSQHSQLGFNVSMPATSALRCATRLGGDMAILSLLRKGPSGTLKAIWFGRVWALD